MFDGGGYVVENTLLNEVVTNDERDFSDWFRVGETSNIRFLCVCQHFYMKFREKRITSVFIYNLDEGVYVPCIVNACVLRCLFAEIEDLVSEAMSFFQHPKICQSEVLWANFYFLVHGVIGGCVDYKFLIINWNFEQV